MHCRALWPSIPVHFHSSMESGRVREMAIVGSGGRSRVTVTVQLQFGIGVDHYELLQKVTEPDCLTRD